MLPYVPQFISTESSLFNPDSQGEALAASDYGVRMPGVVRLCFLQISLMEKTYDRL